MKTNISISADEKLVEEFTTLAKELWTNRTNLLNMMMTDAIKSSNFTVKRKYFDIQVENFSQEEEKSINNLASFQKLDETINNLTF